MIVGILQARMSSARLPGKIMLEASGRSMLEHMLSRVADSKTLDKIVVATTTKEIDNKIEDLSKKLNFQCVRGSEDDVLSRYELASQKSGADIIVRLCSDSPLLDSDTVDKVVNAYLRGNYDYVNNLVPTPRTYPDGMSVEVFSSELLRDAHLNAKRPSEREHVTFYMWKQPEKYRIHRVDYEKDLSKFRFNLDYREDYEFIKKVFENLYSNKHHFTMADIIEFLDKNPEIAKINAHIKPNLGWLKSLEKDKTLGFE